MQVTFLEARVPLTKQYTPTEKHPYPNAYEFKSHPEVIKNLSQFCGLLRSHAALGHCLLKGDIDRPLNWESRAGSTNPNAPTKWICLDIDGLTSVKDISAFMSTIGLGHVSYVLQWSASYGVYNDFTLRAHVFVFLKEAVSPAALKVWLKQTNLTHFKSDLELTKTHTALRWGLDITTCQSDKLIFITPPQCTVPAIDGFPAAYPNQERITYVKSSQEFFDFSTVTVQSAEQVKQMEETQINALRKAINLPDRKATQFKMKEYKGESYLPHPDQATVTGIKEERGFVYLNLNGGNSWAYYHPIDNANFIYNFKGEPTYRTSELLPDYWQGLQAATRAAVRATNQGKQFLAFRDFRTAAYYNGWYDESQDTLTIAEAKSEKQLMDFLINNGQPVPDAVPIWEITYDPHAPTVDASARRINLFRPSKHMRDAEQYTAKPAASRPNIKPYPTIERIITHVVGASMYQHFFNWLAFSFQRRRAPQTAWIFHGTQGTGKGILINRIIAPIFGNDNVARRRMEELEDKFNDYVERSVVIFIDEAQISDSGRNKMIMANIKNWITEPTITVRKMRTSAYEVTNHAGWLFASNMHDPVVVDSSDRRFNVGEYQSSRLVISDADLALVDSELGDFALALATHQIDIDAVRTPMHNEAKNQMIMVSRSSADTIADAILKGDLSILWDALPTVSEDKLPLDMQHKHSLYKPLIIDLILNKRDRISRDELGIIFNYNVGNVPNNPWKLTTYFKHHGLQIKDIRIDGKVTKGLQVEWKNTDDWFNERKEEIFAEQPKLRVVSNQAVA